MNLQNTPLLFVGLALFAGQATAQTDTRVRVSIENLAPTAGTFQTPFWVGFHNGGFDSYDGGLPASALLPNNALERIAEDGDTGPISAEFLALGAGTVDATLPGPNGPIAPGDIAGGSFLLSSTDAQDRYFSYVSMLIPSNDAFIANGSPFAHPIFDAAGNFVAQDFFITGSQVNDAGTEVNDEIPANTAFFGQAAPNVGTDENGVVFDHSGFNALGTGGILDDFRFQGGDFVRAGYPLVRFKFRSAPAITDNRLYRAFGDGNQEVPPVSTPYRARALFRLRQQGTTLRFAIDLPGLQNVTAAHLHLAPAGSNGPVVLGLLSAPTGGGLFQGPVFAEFDAKDLQGPLTGFPIDALIAEIEAGNVYLNVHTDDGIAPQNTGPGDFASGEVRAQLERL